MKKLMVGIAAVVGVAVIGVVYFSSARYSGPTPQQNGVIPFEKFKGPTGRADLERYLTTRHPVGSPVKTLQTDLERSGASEVSRYPGSPKEKMEQIERDWLTDVRTGKMFHKLKYDPTTTTYVHSKQLGIWKWFVVVVAGSAGEIVDIAVYGA